MITTMNIQHLESMYDIIERFSAVKVKERVPDYILGQADQIVNVDISAEDLQDRIREGKVYPPERVERALAHFFTGENLSRLRELTLEEIASALDRQRQKLTGSSENGSERVMVCLSSQGPNTHRLLRKAARLADRFNAPWIAVYVETPQERMEKSGQPHTAASPMPWSLPSNWGEFRCLTKLNPLKRRWRNLFVSTASPISSWDDPCAPGICASLREVPWTDCLMRFPGGCDFGGCSLNGGGFGLLEQFRRKVPLHPVGKNGEYRGSFVSNIL